jgi:hypothetical protein
MSDGATRPRRLGSGCRAASAAAPLAERELSWCMQRRRLERLQWQLEALRCGPHGCRGNILENSELLARLNEAKSKSGTIATSLRESSALTASLDQQRDAYRPLAQR